MRQYREELERKIIVQSMSSRMRKTQAEISPEKSRRITKNKLFFFKTSRKSFTDYLAPYQDVGPDQLMKTAERIIGRLADGEDCQTCSYSQQR